MSQILRVFSIVAACAIAVSATYTQAAPVENKAALLEKNPVPKATLNVLRNDFGMAEVVSLLSASATRASSKAHLETRATLFQFIETKNQGPLVVDAYSVLDRKSHIIGYRLIYRGDSGPLVMAEAVVNPNEKEAAGSAAKLVSASLDSVSTPDGSKTYFLGMQNLDSSRDLKVMVRAGAQSSSATEYVIRYVVSGQ